MKPSSRQWQVGLAAGFAVLIMTFGATHAAFARQGPNRRGQAGGVVRGHAIGQLIPGLGRLGLSEDQRSQMRTIVQNHRLEFETIVDRMRSARQGLQTATTAEGENEGAIRAAAAQLADVQADSAVLRARVRQEIWALLSLEQQQKAAALRDALQQRQQQRRDRRQARLSPRLQNRAP